MIAKILIVDDDPSIRLLIGNFLRSKNHFVLEATDGAQGFETAEREMPHLIIMDLVMPGVYGSTAAQKLLEYWRTSKIPILVLSAFSDEPVRALMKENDHIRFMKKPFELKSLYKLVEEMLPKGGYTP